MSKENSNAKESGGEAGEGETGREKEGGSGKEPGKERIGEESRNLGWYRRRGYEEFRVSLIRRFRFGRDGGRAMGVRMVMVYRRRWRGLVSGWKKQPDLISFFESSANPDCMIVG